MDSAIMTFGPKAFRALQQQLAAARAAGKTEFDFHHPDGKSVTLDVGYAAYLVLYLDGELGHEHDDTFEVE